MQGPVEITFKDINKTPELEDLINKKIAKLEKLCSYMISCRISIERPQTYPDRGNPHQVRIDVKVPPSHELVAKHTASEGNMHDPLQTIINRTFDAMEKQILKLTKQQHREIKNHPQQQVMGIVHRLFPEKGYGFIKTIDTQDDIYFHKNSVLHDDFEKLKIGIGVRFASELGEKGLQASSVAIVYNKASAIMQ